jgi:selenide,water dikinase
MSQLNRPAAEALHEVEAKLGPQVIHAVTDVTGFGFLGHAREMALGNPSAGTPAVTVEIDHRSVPLLPGALDAAREGMLPGGLKNNREFLSDCVAFAPGVPEENRALLYDPQTSGGLLIAIAPEAADAALALLARHGVNAARVGRVLPKTTPILSVI